MATLKKHSSNLTNPRPKPKKRPATNWKQIIIIGALVLAVVSMILPQLVGLFGGLFSGSEAAAVTAPATPPTTVNPENMPEPAFTKEGELAFSSADGKEIARIEIEIAKDDRERSLGLMFRRSMLPTQGMLFVFDHSEPQSFWMKNTLIPLDLLFVDENNVITTIHQNTPVRSEASLPSTGNAKYVVEVNAGFCSLHGIKVGDKISWQ